MKKARIIEILILLFILIIGSFCAYKAVWAVKIKPNLYTITLHDIDSIIKGSPVRFMGIIVGHVTKLERKEDVILCEILITKPNTKIPDGALAKVEFNGLAGSKSIEIMPPKTDDPDIKGIITAETLRISDFMETFKNLREVIMCVKGFVDNITPNGALEAAKAVSNMEDLGGLDKSLDELTKRQEQGHKKLKQFNKFQTRLDELIKKFQKK